MWPQELELQCMPIGNNQHAIHWMRAQVTRWVPTVEEEPSKPSRSRPPKIPWTMTRSAAAHGMELNSKSILDHLFIYLITHSQFNPLERLLTTCYNISTICQFIVYTSIYDSLGFVLLKTFMVVILYYCKLLCNVKCLTSLLIWIENSDGLSRIFTLWLQPICACRLPRTHGRPVLFIWVFFGGVG